MCTVSAEEGYQMNTVNERTKWKASYCLIDHFFKLLPSFLIKKLD